MCLSRAQLIHPSEDIVCYKVVELHNGIMSSPYHDKRWKIDQLESTGSERDVSFRFCQCGELYVESGAFHTFKSLKEACFFSWELKHAPTVVLECVIPKESKLTYEGVFRFGFRQFGSYASEKLKPVKLVIRHPTNDKCGKMMPKFFV